MIKLEVMLSLFSVDGDADDHHHHHRHRLKTAIISSPVPVHSMQHVFIPVQHHDDDDDDDDDD